MKDLRGSIWGNAGEKLTVYSNRSMFLPGSRTDRPAAEKITAVLSPIVNKAAGRQNGSQKNFETDLENAVTINYFEECRMKKIIIAVLSILSACVIGLGMKMCIMNNYEEKNYDKRIETAIELMSRKL